MASTTDEFITSLKVQGAEKAEALIDRHIKKLEKLILLKVHLRYFLKKIIIM